MFNRLLVLLLILLALFIWGCPKDDDKDEPTPTPTEDIASGTANSSDSTSTVVQTPAGATVTIPPGAVPTFDDGSACTQTFSIERTNSSPADVPTGETLKSDIYRFGPEGFIFAAPVEVSIPMMDVPEGHDVLLYRTNEATGEVEQMPAVYDPTTGKITTNTYEFCCWFGTTRPAVNTASGCIMVNNLSHSKWLRVCVDTYTLTFPDQVGNMAGYGEGALWAPIGTIGWASSGKYYIPQGTYNLCLQWSHRDWLSGHTTYHHRMENNVTVNSAWNYWTSPNCSYTLSASDPVGADTGMCTCIPHPSSPAHTGQVQVTLTWFPNDQSGRDMDLHVVEPSGEEISYSHRLSATGGQLDIDNTCVWSESGIAENIYWTTNPPSGQYIVKVHFFPNACGSQGERQNFGVRTVVRGTTRTYQSSAIYGETVEICRFTVSGGAITYQPPEPITAIVNYPPKN
ncbi:hypothetical protein EHM69_11685 [candidate division KSB1 bacterium]|nr:MAG: hypothetical protein EHM69_11685 [candidate division KSB1 bacterium]